jgi:hypothetical protein
MMSSFTVNDTPRHSRFHRFTVTGTVEENHLTIGHAFPRGDRLCTKFLFSGDFFWFLGSFVCILSCGLDLFGLLVIASLFVQIHCGLDPSQPTQPTISGWTRPGGTDGLFTQRNKPTNSFIIHSRSFVSSPYLSPPPLLRGT